MKKVIFYVTLSCIMFNSIIGLITIFNYVSQILAPKELSSKELSYQLHHKEDLIRASGDSAMRVLLSTNTFPLYGFKDEIKKEIESRMNKNINKYNIVIDDINIIQNKWNGKLPSTPAEIFKNAQISQFVWF